MTSDAMAGSAPRFDFERDALAFANETQWDYSIDERSGRQVTKWRDPKPDYTLRCFVLVRVAKQFFLHARFAPNRKKLDAVENARLTREVLKRNSRARGVSNRPVVIPGFSGLREFSAAHEVLFKGICGGAWQSYFQRGNWRMVLPIWRSHQEQVARELQSRLQAGVPQALHVFQFPKLGVNHATMVFDHVESADGLEFLAYDPNMPDRPLTLMFDRNKRGFLMPATRYFVGGPVNAYIVYRNWLY